MTDLDAAHRFSSGHRNLVVMSEVCGCFYCLAVFEPARIHHWIDGEEWERKATALCPRCGIDSVLPSASSLPIGPEFLKAMHDRWFSVEDAEEPGGDGMSEGESVRPKDLGWEPYDPSWLVELARSGRPDLPWLADALRRATRAARDCASYSFFVDPTDANEPGAEWQFETNIVLNSPREGEIVLDVLKDGRIGGVEFLARLCEDM